MRNRIIHVPPLVVRGRQQSRPFNKQLQVSVTYGQDMFAVVAVHNRSCGHFKATCQRRRWSRMRPMHAALVANAISFRRPASARASRWFGHRRKPGLVSKGRPPLTDHAPRETTRNGDFLWFSRLRSGIRKYVCKCVTSNFSSSVKSKSHLD